MASENDTQNKPANTSTPAVQENPAENSVTTPTTPAPNQSAEIEELKALLKESKEALATARKETATLKEQAHQAEIERLKAEGKVKEALEKQLADANAKAEVLAKRNQELARDHTLNDALSSYSFLNKNARDMAFHMLVPKFRKNEDGNWEDISGADIETTVRTFVEDPANSFLMKGSANSGAGASSIKPSSPTRNSLKDYSIEELLAKARDGSLRKK